MLQAEFETKLNRGCLHIYRETHYEEDYQMPMLRQNRIRRLLRIDGCEIEGRSRYTYEINGLISMANMYEKVCMKKTEIQKFVEEILELTERLQGYMLDPNCLILEPKYIFRGADGWYFCYLPDLEEPMNEAFHKLTEYFVKLLDYEDTEGIFLAYELHKATLQEQYDLRQIMKRYEIHAAKRKKNLPGQVRKGKERRSGKGAAAEEAIRGSAMETGLTRGDLNGNIFYVTEEKHEATKLHTEKTEENKGLSEGYEESEQRRNKMEIQEYEQVQNADIVREEGGWWKSWRKAASGIRRKRWGSWEDLILETDGQKEDGLL